MRTMINLSKSEHCVSIQTIAKNDKSFRHNYRSSHFLVTYNELNDLFRNRYLTCKDIYSFAHMNVNEEILTIEFYWLDSNGEYLKGEIESIRIDYKKFKEFVENQEIDKLKLLDVPEVPNTNIKFNAPNALAYILKDKLLKRKFIKFMRDRFTFFRGDEVLIFDDYMLGSFYFKVFNNGVFIYNGGIILHNAGEKDSYFAIHT